MRMQPTRGRHFRSGPSSQAATAPGDQGVESNSRLTSMTAVVLLVFLAAEGLTIVSVRQLINWHVFLGMLLVPPVALKIGSTTWRFARYYSGAPAYRRKGPPQIILRLLGPFVVVLSVVLLASGIALIGLPASWHDRMLLVHKVSFVLWFGAMTIHVVGHILETARLAPLDLARRTRRDVSGAGARTWAVTVAVVAGVVLGVLTWGHTGGYGAGHFGLLH